MASTMRNGAGRASHNAAVLKEEDPGERPAGGSAQRGDAAAAEADALIAVAASGRVVESNAGARDIRPAADTHSPAPQDVRTRIERHVGACTDGDAAAINARVDRAIGTIKVIVL